MVRRGRTSLFENLSHLVLKPGGKARESLTEVYEWGLGKRQGYNRLEGLERVGEKQQGQGA